MQEAACQHRVAAAVVADLAPATENGINATILRISDVRLAPNCYFSGDAVRGPSIQEPYVPHGAGRIKYVSPPSPGTSSSPAGASDVVEYEGFFTQGKRCGRGRLIVNKKFRITCSWSDDVPQVAGDYCSLTTEDGDEYFGLVSMISDGSLMNKSDFAGLAWALRVRFVPDSTGEMLFATDRKKYCGEWQCGQRHGFGIETDVFGSYHFAGAFQYDSRDGSGIVFNVAQRTVLSGSWKDGKVHGSAALHLPNQAAVVQSHSWTNVDHYEYSSATILRSRVVDGMWEPLFVTFDNTLALTVAESMSSPPSSGVGAAGAGSSSPSQRLRQSVIQLLEAILHKDDFIALLTTFQRTFYFLYGSCERLHAHNALHSACKTKATGEAVRRVLFPESWCCLVGVDPDECLHAYSREKSYTSATFRQALSDTASFVFSVRLRLLSYLAAIPSACDVNVGRTILEMCWDTAFSAVEPLVMFMAKTICKPNIAAVRNAIVRCRALTIEDFVGHLDSLWFPSATADIPKEQIADEENASTEKANFLREIELQKSLWAQSGLCDLEPSSASQGLRVEEHPSSSGNLVTVAAADRVQPSLLVSHLNSVFQSARDASRIATRHRSPDSLAFFQEQLMHYSVLRVATSSRNPLEAMLTLVATLVSESVEPPLPGAHSSLLSYIGQGRAGNDSLDANSMLSGDTTDIERHASLQTRRQVFLWLQALQRAAGVWPQIVLQRWGGIVAPLDDILLRVQHSLIVKMAKPDLNQESDDEDEDTELIMPLSSKPTTPVLMSPKKPPHAITSCRQLIEQLGEAPPLDVAAATHDILMFLIDSPVVLMKKLVVRLSSLLRAAGSAATPVVTSPADPAVPFVKKTVRSSLDAVFWYRDIIPRLAALSGFFRVIGVTYDMKCLAGNGTATVAPEDCTFLQVSLQLLQHPSNVSQQQVYFVRMLLEQCVDEWEKTVSSNTFAHWRSNSSSKTTRNTIVAVK